MQPSVRNLTVTVFSLAALGFGAIPTKVVAKVPEIVRGFDYKVDGIKQPTPFDQAQILKVDPLDDVYRTLLGAANGSQALIDCGYATSDTSDAIVGVSGLNSARINDLGNGTYIVAKDNNGTPSVMFIPRVELGVTQTAIHHVLLKGDSMYVVSCDFDKGTEANARCQPATPRFTTDQVKGFLSSLAGVCKQYIGEVAGKMKGDPSARPVEKAARDGLLSRHLKALREIGVDVK
mgnify:CR=1 FL=1